jgi:hypothetical protein
MSETLVARHSAPIRAGWLFLIGFIAVLTVHQATGWLLVAIGIIPAGAYQPWATNPIPPLGVPSIISMAFWGGLWAALLGLAVIRRARGTGYWLGWFLACGIAPTIGFLYIVPLIKGLPVVDLASMPIRATIGFILNGAWGLGIAALLAVTGLRNSLWPA